MNNKVFNIPNCLSVFRIILVPFFAWMYLTGHTYRAVAILILSGLSDMFDGIIARKFNMITELGKILDPIADKLTQVAIGICVAIMNYKTNKLLVILIGVCVIKELLMSAGALTLLHTGKKPGSAKWFGKVGTFLFYIVMALVICIPMPVWLSNILLLIVSVFMIFSFIQYVFVYLSIKRQNNNL